MRLPDPTSVDAERLRRSLPAFLHAAWPQVDPAPLVPGFHLDAICEHLQAVADGKIRRLLINVPPRHGKSIATAVAFPAWVWTRAPTTRFLTASYATQLAAQHSLQTRRLIESDWYQARWGDRVTLTGDQNEKSRYDLLAGGGRMATGVGGAATGHGGEIIVIDDPHKLEEAHSPAARHSTISWFASAMATRLNHPKSGAIVIVGQRVHEQDLFGHLLAQGGWEHLCLPLEYDSTHPFLWPDDPRKTDGEVLVPERYGPKEVDALKRDLGPHGAAAQLQQRPTPAGGNIFLREWWQWYPPNDPPARIDDILMSWDLAFTGGPSSDYVVGQVWAKAGPNAYLLHQSRAHRSFTETIDAIQNQLTWVQDRYRIQPSILIEQAANGAAVIDTLQSKISAIMPVKPTDTKEARAHTITPFAVAGNIHLPGHPAQSGTGYDPARTPRWVQDLVAELETFPHAAHDDQVDAMTQAIDRLLRYIGPRLRVL